MADNANPTAFNPQIYLDMAENRYLSGNPDSGNRHIHQFLNRNSIVSVKEFIQYYHAQHPEILPFVDPESILNRLYAESLSILNTTEQN